MVITNFPKSMFLYEWLIFPGCVTDVGALNILLHPYYMDFMCIWGIFSFQ
jgi:hypothetical protein